MFTVELKQDKMTAALRKAVAAMEDMTLVMKTIGDVLAKSTIKRFGTGTSPDGAKWAPKSQTTLNAYGARKSNRIDVRPLFGPNNRLNAEIFAEAERDQVAVGSGLPYAAMMQFGGQKSAFPHLWGDIPARPFLGISPTDSTNIVAEIEDWLKGLLD
jgi:phage virion morphogenesis protein